MCIKLEQQIKDTILQILSQSPIPEDYKHAVNVLEWVKRFQPAADFALKIAALSHDIERAFPDRKVLRTDYNLYDAFKRAHAENSAKIVSELLTQYPINIKIIERVHYLVRYHEFGKDDDPDLIVLKDADSLSFFINNLPHYFNREGEKETYWRMQWGYNRLSKRAKPYLKRLCYDEDILNKFLQNLFKVR